MTLVRAGESYREASTSQLLQTAHLVARSVESELRASAHIMESYGPTQGLASPRGGSLFAGRLSSTLIRKGPPGRATPLDAVPGVPADLAIRAAKTGTMAVSDIFMSGEAAPSPTVAIAVPGRTTSEGTEVSILATNPTALVQTLTREDSFARTQLLAVTDGTGRVIARSREAGKFIGKPVPDWARLTGLGKQSGTFEARTIEGPKVMFAFHTIHGTPGWVAVVGEPLSIFNDRWRGPISIMLAASGATLLFAFLFAVLLARRILLPIKHLAQNASAIAEGKGGDKAPLPAAPASLVAEFETLRRSLESAEVETRRSHQALHQSYEALRQAERLARIGSWTLDISTGRFNTSDMLYELNGADPAGPPLAIKDLRNMFAPETLEMVSAAITRCVETGLPYVMEAEHRRPDGTSFPAYLRGQAVRDEAGQIVGIAGTVQDISDRKEERERLATLADNLPSGVIYRLEEKADGDLAVTYMSAGIVRLIGVTAAEIIHDRMAFLGRIDPADQAVYADAMERSRLTGAPVDETVQVKARDGRTLCMHVRSAPRQLPDGRTVWDGIARDVTSERQAADALQQAKETAEAAERTKSDFLATMSHEIRTPMNTVIGMTRLTLQTPLAPKQRNYLEKINISAKALLGIINDVLDFSKIEAGGLELEDTHFSLESVLDSVSAVMAMPAEEKGLEIAYAVAVGTPRRLRGDPLRLGQVLTNLTSNAIKFTDSGEVIVSIQPVLAQDGASLLQFTVRDTGIGLSADQISGLFRPFTQAGNDTSRKYGGTGLGLAICKQLVELMGGRIWAEGAPGQGCSFCFTIPNTPSDEQSQTEASSRSSSDLRDRRVLIVDDNMSARHILSEMMSGFGLAVEAVDSGARALSRLHAEAERGTPFDIVLMDWRMPVMDGLETARRIRADERLLHMPAVLMVTAYGREEVLRGVEQLGLEGLLIKPVTESVMFNTVRDILSPARLELAAQKAVDSSAARRDSISRSAFVQLSGKRVLVVDDNALNREVAGDFLTVVGVEVETAIDGLDALAKLNTSDFDAVLMDVHMPRMDGLSAVREIRRQDRWSQLPIIALTAQARVADQNASRRAGMTAHLTKPVDETALYRTLAEVLGLASAGAPVGRPSGKSADTAGTGFDYAVALHRFGGSSERVQRMLESFLRDTEDAPQRLDEHMQADDTAAIAALAHALKGSAGYFGARDFLAAAERFEQAAREDDRDAARAFAPEFRQRLLRLLDDARACLSDLRETHATHGDPGQLNAVLDLIARAAPLVQVGDYAASRLLEDIAARMLGHADRILAEEAQAHYDDLELEAAGVALQHLRTRIEATRAARL